MSPSLMESTGPHTATAPRPLPGPSNLFAGAAAYRFLTNPFEFLQSLARTYGDLVGFRIGPVRYCLVNRAECIRDVLVTRQAEFTKGAVLAYVTKWIMGNGLLSSEGDFHLRQRRLCQPAFDPEHLARYGDIMVRSASDVRDRWRDGDVVDLYEEMNQLALSTAARTLFGFDIGEQLEEFRKAYSEVQRGYSLLQLMLSVFIYKLGVQRHFSSSRSRRGRQRLDEIVYGVIAAKQAAADPGDDLLASLIRATDSEGDGLGMDRQQLRDEAMTFILAGHDTVATSLTWSWYLLSQHPREADKLREEVDAIAPDRPLTAADLPRLRQATCVFQETMRLYPAIWTIGRTAIADVVLDGYRIPGGCQVLVSPFVTHRDARYFPDPLSFRPERWAEGAPPPPDLAYFPFGGGKRRCIGRSFALMEGALVLATLAQQWNMRCLDAQPPDVRRALVLQPRRRITMRLERRRDATPRVGREG